MWYPGWVAKVGGLEVEVQKADFIFMAICAPEGKNLVTLEYQPATFFWGAVISLAGWFLFISIYFLSAAQRRRKPAFTEIGSDNKE